MNALPALENFWLGCSGFAERSTVIVGRLRLTRPDPPYPARRTRIMSCELPRMLLAEPAAPAALGQAPCFCLSTFCQSLFP
jgi:hypothetical protein